MTTKIPKIDLLSFALNVDPERVYHYRLCISTEEFKHTKWHNVADGQRSGRLSDNSMLPLQAGVSPIFSIPSIYQFFSLINQLITGITLSSYFTGVQHSIKISIMWYVLLLNSLNVVFIRFSSCGSVSKFSSGMSELSANKRVKDLFNTVRPRKNDIHFPDIFKCIFLNQNK